MSGQVQQKVVVIGAGVAGMVVALLLKQKGWEPIVLEKVKHMGDAGLGLVIQSNGMKVMNKAGAVDLVLDGTVAWQNWNDWSSAGIFLGGPGSKVMASYTDLYGWPSVSLSRTKLQLGLKAAIEKVGISLLENWRLKDIRVSPDRITAVSVDGREIDAAFAIGADGLKSATREVIFGRHGVTDRDPSFTGIEVVGGRSPTPQFLKERPGLNCFWGQTEAIITHPMEDGWHLWGATLPRDHDVPESWQTIPSDELKAEKKTYLERWKDWHPVISELIQNSKKMQRIGLYDRGELPVERWYHDRMVLIGDAAHPMTPHAGQGANQCLVDAWAAFEAIPAFDADRTLTTKDLERSFHAIAQKRQPPTSATMAYALEQGESRVLRGDRASEQGLRERDDKIRAKWVDVAAALKEQDVFLREPFDDKGGYQKWLNSQHGATTATT